MSRLRNKDYKDNFVGILYELVKLFDHKTYKRSLLLTKTILHCNKNNRLRGFSAFEYLDNQCNSHFDSSFCISHHNLF